MIPVDFGDNYKKIVQFLCVANINFVSLYGRFGRLIKIETSGMPETALSEYLFF